MSKNIDLEWAQILIEQNEKTKLHYILQCSVQFQNIALQAI